MAERMNSSHGTVFHHLKKIGKVSRLGNYTRAFGDGPRNFEPWSSDVDDTCELASPLLTTTPMGGRFSSRQI
ncbi:hypothetical protein TNCV_4106861 [Trichonephila clavipes]|nr:hypothetical protein TNCV_4106861 [Trichonephila clavipes]